jgi:hypothetical protein
MHNGGTEGLEGAAFRENRYVIYNETSAMTMTMSNMIMVGT